MKSQHSSNSDYQSIDKSLPGVIIMSPSSLVRFSLTALAVAASAQAQGSFVDECTDVRLSKDWLIAKCLTGDDATSRIESSIALNSIISNDNARLVVSIAQSLKPMLYASLTGI